MTDDILTAADVAAMFKLDKKTVYAAVKRGEIPSKRVGRKLLFSQRALLEWWRSQGGAVSDRR
jgi:excisionase family DNA binding protein